MGAHRGIASRLVGPSCASRRAIVLTLTSACPGASLKARESQTEVSEPQSWAQGSCTLERRRSRCMRGWAWGPRRW